MMHETLEYLRARQKKDAKFTWEIIVVDDHSRDATVDVATSYNTDSTPVYALRLRKNAGKGGAVRVGALHAVGEMILMVDADGATKFSDLEKLEKEYNPSAGVEVVFGSRDHLRTAEESVQKRNPIRNLLMFGFHVVVLAIIGTHIKDTQCGFKLFSKRASRILFKSLHLERWAFDTEIVLLCQILGIKVAEVDVEWMEIAGSKLNVIIASIQMLRDMVLLRLMYMLHIWVPNLAQ
jgi:dolichyl-phosphate beta-glucosyltransferase